MKSEFSILAAKSALRSAIHPPKAAASRRASTVEVGGIALLALRAEEVGERVLDQRRSVRSGSSERVAVAVVDEVDGVDRPHHVEVEVERRALDLALRELRDVVVRPEQAVFLAKEIQVPVIALSQLNRGPEQRADKKPAISDLRESGSLEQDADIVILLHRESAYEKENPRAGEADFIVAKHRNGPTDTVTVAAQLHLSRFVDMAI